MDEITRHLLELLMHEVRMSERIQIDGAATETRANRLAIEIGSISTELASVRNQLAFERGRAKELRDCVDKTEKALRALHDAATEAAPHIRSNSPYRRKLMSAVIDANNHIIPF